jgi:hypothetical protein
MAGNYLVHQEAGAGEEQRLLSYLTGAYPDYLICWRGDETKPWYKSNARIDFELYPLDTSKPLDVFDGATEYEQYSNMLDYLIMKAEQPDSLLPAIFVEAKDRSPQIHKHNPQRTKEEEEDKYKTYELHLKKSMGYIKIIQ